MKVNLAIQIFSRSVSDALNTCNLDMKLKQFQNSSATAHFCRILNDIFLLSKNVWGKPFSTENQQSIKEKLREGLTFLYSIKNSEGTHILQTSRKTGFLGLIICIASIINLFDNVVRNRQLLKYLLTYKLSQDHLEMFFSAVRSTAVQFEGAYKRLNAEIGSSSAANCIPQDNTHILTVSSILKPTIGALSLPTIDTLSNITDCNLEIDIIEEFLHSTDTIGRYC